MKSFVWCVILIVSIPGCFWEMSRALLMTWPRPWSFNHNMHKRAGPVRGPEGFLRWCVGKKTEEEKIWSLKNWNLQKSLVIEGMCKMKRRFSGRHHEAIRVCEYGFNELGNEVIHQFSWVVLQFFQVPFFFLHAFNLGVVVSWTHIFLLLVFPHRKKNHPSTRSRGELLKLQGDFYGAIEDLNVALRLEPKNTMALSSRGDCKRMLDDCQGAMADL